MKINKSIYYIILFIILFIIGISTSKKSIIKLLGGYTEIETIYSIDTLEIKVDTTRIISDWLVINADSFVTTIIKKDVITRDSLRIDTLVIDVNGDPVDSNYTWIEKVTSAIHDSLIDGTITTTIDFFRCKMLSQNLVYKPKFPIIITKTVPIVETITNTISNDYRIGGGALIDNFGEVNLIGAYQKNGWQFQVNYELISTDVNKEIGFGIIKFF